MLLTDILWVILIVLPNSTEVSTYPGHSNSSDIVLPFRTKLK